MRHSSDAMDAILGVEYPVHNFGFVRAVDYMGTDASIVRAARVSYGQGTKTISEDRDLIRYLLRHKHTTPIESCELQLHMRLPIFVARQLVRHRTASISEVSGRYSEMPDRFYTQQVWSAQSKNNKQGSAEPLDPDLQIDLSDGQFWIQSEAYSTYTRRLESGVSREQARIDLPLSLYTEWYWKMDLHNLLHFLRLRLDSHAQAEIRAYAEVIGRIVSVWCPLVWEAFNDYSYNTKTLSRMEIELVRKLYKAVGNLEVQEDSGMSKREVREFMEFLDG